MTSAPSALRPSVPSIRRHDRAVTRIRSLRALGSPAFRAYVTAQGLASFGTWIQNITQDWLVLTLTRSGEAVGLTAAFQFLPALLLGPYGAAWRTVGRGAGCCSAPRP